MRGLSTLICLLGLLLLGPAQAEPSGEPLAEAEARAPAGAGEGRIYRMTDEQGRVIFTDSPPAGADAREVRPQPSNIMPAPARPQGQARPSPPASPDAFAGYSEIVIHAPAADQTFQNPQQPISVQVGVTPALQAGHQLRILHNGTPLAGTQLVQPVRGAHTLVAQVLDDDGKVLAESGAVTVHVHRPSVLLGPGARRDNDGDGKGKEKGKAVEDLVQILPWYPAER